MTSKQPEKDIESLGEAASRLLAGMVRRARKGAATISDHALPAAKEPGSTTGTDQKFKKPGAPPAGEADGSQSSLEVANCNFRPRFVAHGGGGPASNEGEKRCVVSELLTRQPDRLTADAHHAPDPSERAVLQDRAVRLGD